MPNIQVSSHVNAAPDEVFAVYTDLASAENRIESIMSLEILTEGPVGVGTRFKETRKMFGKESTEEMEISALEAPKSYSVRAHSCGTDYLSIFKFTPENGGTRVDWDFNGKPVSFMAKLMSPMMVLMSGMMKKMMGKDMADLKQAIEGDGAA